MPRLATVLAPWFLALALPTLARAQVERPPEECGQTEATARYGIAAGALVTLQRHRFVGGDDNWDPQMVRWLGRAAHVTSLAGVDANGCPCVHVDIDGGQWFWRVRDLGIGTGPSRAPGAPHAAHVSGIPQQCSAGGPSPSYGAVTVGATVTLGHHRPVQGEENWADEMQAFVGRAARVVELAGADAQGCPGIRVDVDGGQWFWRIRDLRMPGVAAEPAGPESLVASTGVGSDHGRPEVVITWGAPTTGPSGLFGSGAPRPPQECGLTDTTAQWGSIAMGSTVILGAHTPVHDDTNWDDAMAAFVGQRARVIERVGVDDQGCPIVRVDADRGQFVWRIRDMTLP